MKRQDYTYGVPGCGAYMSYHFLEKETSKPLVIHTHGLAGTIDSPHNQAMIGAYLKQGHNVLGIDARYSNSNRSFGDLERYTVGGHIRDIQIALEWVGGEHPEWTHNQRVILSGHSFGGLVMPLVAANLPEYRYAAEVGGVVCFSPVVSGNRFIKALGLEARKEWKAGRHEELQYNNTGKSNRITDANWNEWLKHDLIKIMPDIGVPFAIIQAEKDEVTLPEYAEQLIDEEFCVHYATVENADHIFHDESGRLMTDKINESVKWALMDIELYMRPATNITNTITDNRNCL